MSPTRSFTDPYSNDMVLSNFDIRDHLAAPILARFPTRALCTFLHEATHHWCFRSPVGLALTLLAMRARRRALAAWSGAGAPIDEQTRNAILSDLLRYDFTLRLMRPLAEGLALFAEHDVTVGNARTISQPSLLAAILCAGRDPNTQQIDPDPTGTLDRYAPLLAEARLRNSHVRRKADLFIQPMDCSDGGYLPGYLTIKVLQYIALRQGAAAFSDSDLFYHYTRCYFYDDWDLVAVLLDPTQTHSYGVDRIFDYFNRRLAQYRVQTTQAAVDDFEHRGVERQPDTFEFAGQYTPFRLQCFPACPSPDSRPGKLHMANIFRELTDEPPDDPLESALFDLDRNLLILRDAMSLGKADFAARVSSGRMLHLMTDEGQFLMAKGAPDSMTTGWSGRILVEEYFTCTTPGLYMAFRVDNDLVAVQSLGEKQAVPPEFEDSLRDVARLEAASELTGRAIEAVLDDEDSILAREWTQQVLAEGSRGMYTVRALAFAPGSDLQPLIQKVLTQGFLPLFADDSKLLLDAAHLSLRASLLLKTSAELRHRWSRESWQESVEAIEDCLREAFGEFLLTRRSDGEVLHTAI